MKYFKSLVLCTAVLALMMSSACTKEYVCQCNVKYNGAVGMPDSTMKEYPIRDTKKKAQSLCKENSAKYNKDNIDMVETCVLY